MSHGRNAAVPPAFLISSTDGFQGFGAASDDEDARAESGEVEGHGATESGATASEENCLDLSVSGRNKGGNLRGQPVGV